MAIGIDLDEVVFPCVEYFCKFLNKKHNINFKYKEVLTYNLSENAPYKIKGIQATKEQSIEDFYEFIETPEFKAIQPYPDAIEAISELRKLDFIVGITSRQNELQEHTRWQLNHFSPNLFSAIYFGNAYSKDKSKPQISKRELCKDHYVSLLLEDNARYALDVSQDIPVILFRRPWNTWLERADDIYPVANWQEAVITAQKIYKKAA
ncbi:MAG: HAD hydrolase-like protein [archaeon]|nr:HAD hydrolase-like protein [archaeon]